MIQDVLSDEGINSFLDEEIKNKIKIDIRECVGSTNDEVKKLALQGEKEWCVLLSRCQTQGKGRLGRSFFSPDSTGVYMSILLRPRCKPEEAVLITTAAAVAVCHALEKVGAQAPLIKWVNDIYINGKKVCGILTEAGFGAQGGALDYAVLGIGVNIYAPEGDFPCELQSVAGYAFDDKKENLTNEFVAEILNSFHTIYSSLTKRLFIEEYRRRCFVLGKEINVISQGDVTPAKALDIDENCNLLVKYSNGEKVLLSSGEISVRVAN